ncbi:MAG: hypothetical protein S4CHLAM2_03720 [Chlamydiales bacterium]|nr:hypothetical protein [Chlamydiales bacterium]
MFLSRVDGGPRPASKTGSDTGINYTKCAAYGVAAIAGLGLIVAAAAAALAVPGLNPWQIGGLAAAGVAGAGLGGTSISLMIRGVAKEQKQHRLKEKLEKAQEKVMNGKAKMADWQTVTQNMSHSELRNFIVALREQRGKADFSENERTCLGPLVGGRLINLLRREDESSIAFQKLSNLYTNWFGGSVGNLKSMVISEKREQEERLAAAREERDHADNLSSYT